jgi:hypothetical protein
MKSKRMMWVMYFGSKVFHLLLQENLTQSATAIEHIGWIDKLEQKFTTTSHSSPSINNVGEQLMVHLEVDHLYIS